MSELIGELTPWAVFFTCSTVLLLTCPAAVEGVDSLPRGEDTDP